MLRATSVRRPSEFNGERVVGTVTLAFDDRHRRRIRLLADDGTAFLLDLAQAVRLCDGDRLMLDDGRAVVVRAAVEPVAEIYCANPVETARMAWHVGNRHAPLEVLPDGGLRIRDDHVLVAMARGLGARVRRTHGPFSPEGGAYHGEAKQQDHHGHGHAHPH